MWKIDLKKKIAGLSDEIGSNDADMWRAEVMKLRGEVKLLNSYLATANETSAFWRERAKKQNADKVIMNEAESWFSAVSKALEPVEHLAKAKDRLAVAENVYEDADSSEDTLIALAHAMISQADSQVSIAASFAKLASCVSDHDATYHYIRTGKGG